MATDSQTISNIDIHAEQLNDEDFLAQFEDQTLASKHFKHLGHLRLTWLYLLEHDVETSIALVNSGIQAYAKSVGAETKFHVTLTDAMVRIVAKRMAKMDQKDWQMFLKENYDLVDDAISVLSQHFSQELLFSETARVSLVPPDRMPLH